MDDITVTPRVSGSGAIPHAGGFLSARALAHQAPEARAAAMRGPDSRGYPGHGSCNCFAPAMNEDETADVVLFEQSVLDADDLVEQEIEDLDDDYEPSEEVILLDLVRLDDDDIVAVA